MKLLNKDHINFNNIVFLAYIIPLMVWPISLHPTFTLFEKMICIGIFSLIFFGTERLINDTTLAEKKIPFKKIKNIIPDLNISIFSLLII